MTERAIFLTVEREPALVRDAGASRPTAWGALAASGVRTFKELEGRAPTEEERRAIWAGLWRAVVAVSRGG
jgi:hypothetical protein